MRSREFRDHRPSEKKWPKKKDEQAVPSNQKDIQEKGG